MPTLLFALVLFAQAGPDIQTEEMGPGRWRLTITVEGETDPLRVAPRLTPRAQEICGDAGFHFGRYTFQSDQEVEGPSAASAGRLTLVQNVTCGPPPVEPPTAPAPALTPTETAGLQPEILALTDGYFTAVDEERHIDSYRMVTEAMTGGATLEEWIAGERARREIVGAMRTHQIGRLTWYANPDGAPFGHYAAVDYVASYALQDECGYIVWYRPVPGEPFRLVRKQTILLPLDLDATTRASLRQQHCILL